MSRRSRARFSSQACLLGALLCPVACKTSRVDECRVVVPHLEEAIDQTFTTLATAVDHDDLARMAAVEDGRSRSFLAYMAIRLVGRQSDTVERAADSVEGDIYVNVLYWIVGAIFGRSPDTFVLSLPETLAPLVALAADTGAPDSGTIQVHGKHAAIPLDTISAALEKRSRSRLSELRDHGLGECRREEIIGSFDPKSPAFLELASVSHSVTKWARSVRDFVFVRYRCPSSVGVLVFTRYLDDSWDRPDGGPPSYRFPILAWRFLTSEQWQRLRVRMAAPQTGTTPP